MSGSNFRSIVHRGLSNVAIMMDLCDWGNWCYDRGDTKIDSFTREVTVGSLLRAIARAGKVSKSSYFRQDESLHMTGFSALVASLASNIERSSVRSTAVP